MSNRVKRLTRKERTTLLRLLPISIQSEPLVYVAGANDWNLGAVPAQNLSEIVSCAEAAAEELQGRLGPEIDAPRMSFHWRAGDPVSTDAVGNVTRLNRVTGAMESH